MTQTVQLPPTIGSADEVAKAQRALGNIINLLNNAQAQSQRYNDRESPDDTSALDPNDSNLYQRAHRIVTQRQRNTSFARKAA
jgi:hypothetical protein